MDPRITSQYRGITAFSALILLLSIYVLAFPDKVHLSAREMFLYSVLCALLLSVPANLWASQGAWKAVQRRRYIDRHIQQFDRLPDTADPNMAGGRRLFFVLALPSVLRFVILGIAVYLSYRLGWSFKPYPNQTLLPYLGAVSGFASRGGFSRVPIASRGSAVLIGLLLLVAGFFLPVPLSLFIVTSAVIGGLARTLGLAIFQLPLEYDGELRDRTGMLSFLRSVPPERP
jgi:hypothetical protein